MLLNKLPCLDKGYIAYVDSSCDSNKLKDLALEFFKKTDGKFLSDIANLTLIVKCPLFVQLNLSTFNLKIINTPTTDVEAYLPNVGEISSPDHETNKAISQDMERTTAALLINPKAYQQDGCNQFISQVMMPISTYTTLIVHGSYNQWKLFCDQNNMPAPVTAYANAVRQILSMEWK